MNAKIIIAHLRKELELQRRHAEILGEQKEALIANDQPRFVKSQFAYALFQRELEGHVIERKRVMGDAGVSLRIAMSEWTAADRAAGESLRDAILEELQRVQGIGKQNGELVRNQLNYIQFVTSVMVITCRRNLGYAPGGMSRSHAGNIFINQTA